MNNLLGNMPPVVKNLLILNVVMFIVTVIGEQQGIRMTYVLGGYVFGSPFFEPYQMVTHFFMHGGLFHIFFNMFALVVFGSALEQVWGPKRFFIFYIATALGAFIFHQVVGYMEFKQIESALIADGYDMFEVNKRISELHVQGMIFTEPLLRDYQIAIGVPVVGASGAVYGLLAAFAYLFPNTQLMLLFPPIPVKAKWLVLFLVGIALFNSVRSQPGDNIAHLAHLGGAVVGFIIVLIWQRDKKNFY
ncbi:MAG: rhomboid family intramembrane serine protease [Crocinitomicaceae bacterium]|nr:rhomboid family intramembrane serine protease [Crocinitomicaceae bacterium]